MPIPPCGTEAIPDFLERSNNRMACQCAADHGPIIQERSVHQTAPLVDHGTTRMGDAFPLAVEHAVLAGFAR